MKLPALFVVKNDPQPTPLRMRGLCRIALLLRMGVVFQIATVCLPTIRGLVAGLIVVAVLLTSGPNNLPAADPIPPAANRPADAIDFARDIAPLLEQRCVRCHHHDRAKGGLSLSHADDLQKGGDSGAVLDADHPLDSLLLEVVTGEKPRMPAEGAPLKAEEVQRLKRWAQSGANWPAGKILEPKTTGGLDWWSFQPVRSVPVPDLPAAADLHRKADSASPTSASTANSTAVPSLAAWPRNPVDRFILQKQSEQGLRPSAELDRTRLLRRVMFDLVGLPPSPEQVQEFVSDPDPDAYERLVDRLLASPQYGERWARHWLDIAHYADTHGFERDQRRDHAWRYRDWVIQALNSDLPYDEFLRLQLAGDVLWPDRPDAVIATGFLAAGPWDFVGQAETKSEVLKRAARADDLDDLVTQVITAACGVTINCARCHDHKLDPITQRDYYSLWAVFSGVKRGDREVSPAEVQSLAARRQTLNAELQQVRKELAALSGKQVDLAELVGGRSGWPREKPVPDGATPPESSPQGNGIDPRSGQAVREKRGFLENIQVNQFVRSNVPFVDGVFVPDKSADGTVISSTGLRAMNLPRTSGQVWDAIRCGPVNSQHSTVLDGVDFGTPEHTLLSLHANVGITFDLAQLRAAGVPSELAFTATAGYFGQTPRQGASYWVLIDGEVKAQRLNFGRDDGSLAIDLPIPEQARCLTLIATDGGNGIAHDQLGFADAWLVNRAAREQTAEQQQTRERLTSRKKELEQQLSQLAEPAKVYAVRVETPAEVKIQLRGNPEQPGEEVSPGAIACVSGGKAEFGAQELTDAQRRIALANWIVAPENPLTRRVIVNRLWQYHFGQGLVETPSDFGAGGSLPSHPELLDWLAEELRRQNWSLKAMHRLICTSATYRQQSATTARTNPTAASRSTPAATSDGSPQVVGGTHDPRLLDSSNRLLWRMNPRRLEAESLRDSVLAVSGCLHQPMFGPGYRDFDYQEEYAPVYKYVTPDRPELWRRSIYRFVVLTTAHQFLTTLDCPSPANLVPTRNVTTTALQSLTLLNNPFMLQQSEYFAARVRRVAGITLSDQIDRAFRLALARSPTREEQQAAELLVKSQGLSQLCRMLLNSNEFVYID